MKAGKPRWGESVISVFIALSMSSCTVGPDFKPPPAPSETRYIAPDESSVSGVNAGRGAPKQTFLRGTSVASEWWTCFRSPNLDALVRQAIAGSPTLQSAQARLAQAQEAIAAASSALYPQINFGVGITREKVDAATFGLSPSAFPLPPNANVFQLGPSVRYPIDLFGGTRRQIEQQTALVDVQRYQLDVAYLTLTGNTVSQAIQLAAIRAQLQAVRDILTIDRQNLDLVRRESTAGTVSDTDVVTAASQLAADETLWPGLDQQLKATGHALAVLLGRAPSGWSPPVFDLTGLTLPGQLPLSLPSELVHQRPDIRTAEAQLHAASAEVGVATARLYPAVTLSGSIGSTALDPGHLFDPAALVWSVAAGVSQPIFDGGLRQAERRAALAAFKASAAEYQQAVLQAFGQVADILQALAHDADLLAAQQRALDIASDAVHLQRANYAAGGTGVLNLLDAQRQYQRALLGYTRTKAQRYQDTVQLLIAMGGDWRDPKLAVTNNNLMLGHGRD
jgi:NodT family efflux transporter outer membrane factor (OMF) lipoprotein